MMSQPMMSQPMMMPQPMVMQQPMMMSQPMMMQPQQQQHPQQSQHPQQQQQQQSMMSTTTGSNAGELIKEQLDNGNGNSNGSRSILDMEPEKPESSEKTQDDSKGEGKRVIKLG
jgi:hypothetical protein